MFSCLFLCRFARFWVQLSILPRSEDARHIINCSYLTKSCESETSTKVVSKTNIEVLSKPVETDGFGVTVGEPGNDLSGVVDGTFDSGVFAGASDGVGGECDCFGGEYDEL